MSRLYTYINQDRQKKKTAAATEDRPVSDSEDWSVPKKYQTPLQLARPRHDTMAEWKHKGNTSYAPWKMLSQSLLGLEPPGNTAAFTDQMETRRAIAKSAGHFLFSPNWRMSPIMKSCCENAARRCVQCYFSAVNAIKGILNDYYPL